MNLGASTLKKMETVLEQLQKRSWLPVLLLRLFVGYFFIETGWGKVHNLDSMTERFVQWGIPLPGLNAALSGYTELIGGALILVGLFTALPSVPVCLNIVVAVAPR